ncbi:DUF1203 domain-containing protein [Pseudomonas sp. HMWF032]|uniref:DUF1203 domain-containing protein n=1 Tax=Pseudomonas sp. HMWF032 TaxID=2056866 RepID=UPI000D3CEABC|nr:DUF1203 domain-containing protein [Pseudomonas sp. HMWF032]PTS86419.1 DUF1203 domain-containing protein [Pseudomonas sp. HMWF032]PTT81392.1 DUF1203 domain-containing protein [Pseudomonas sp. HMWF010]
MTSTHASTDLALRVCGISSDAAERIWQGGLDAHGQLPVRQVAQGMANPCRHCLNLITPGTPKLILAYRPFTQLQPYAEVGPIFLHAEPCQHYDQAQLPAWFAFLEPALIRGYDSDDWIRYDTGQVVPGSALSKTCQQILSDLSVAYVHIRSKFNCFQCRVERAHAD